MLYACSLFLSFLLCWANIPPKGFPISILFSQWPYPTCKAYKKKKITKPGSTLPIHSIFYWCLFPLKMHELPKDSPGLPHYLFSVIAPSHLSSETWILSSLLDSAKELLKTIILGYHLAWWLRVYVPFGISGFNNYLCPWFQIPTNEDPGRYLVLGSLLPTKEIWVQFSGFSQRHLKMSQKEEGLFNSSSSCSSLSGS